MWNSDVDLIIALKSGDQRAFRFLYEKYFVLVFRFATKYVDHEKAEDIVQDVFFKLWGYKEKINDRPHAVRYLLMACKHGCINILRYEKRQEKKMKEITLHEFGTYEHSVDAQHANILEHQLALLEKAVAKLPTSYKLIYNYAYCERRTNQEIAQLTGLSYQTVVNKKIIALKIIRGVVNDRKLAHSLSLFLVYFFLI